MPHGHHHPHQHHSPRTENRLEQLLAEIRRRPPRREAKSDVTVSAPHARSAYLSYTRVAGPRDAVLDYAAYLFAEDRGVGAAALDLDAVECDEPESLTLLLSRSLYSPETA